MRTALTIFFATATVLAAPAILSEMVSLPRVAYVFGRWFDGPHDGFQVSCAGHDAVRPVIPDHESVSVGVTCGYDTTLSSVVAGLDWVMGAATVDSKVVVPDHLRGHRAVEDRLDSMRECGMDVPDAFVATERKRSSLPAFAFGFAACSCLLTACACARGFFKPKAPCSPIHRRHTWEMTARDRMDLHAYAGQADDQEAARARRESFKSYRP